MQKTFFLILFSFLVKVSLYGQTDTISEIVKHSLEFDSLMSSNFKLPEKRIYMFGEYHTYSKSSSIAFNLFNKIDNKNGKKMYLFESSKSNEYFFKKYLRTNNSKMEYNGGQFNLFAYRKIKRTFINMKNHFEKDTNIVIRSFDIEDNFDFAIMALYNILIDSHSTLFDVEINKMKENQGMGRYSNEKNYSISHWVIDSFNSDTAKYYKNLKDDNYYYYSNIVKGLGQGLLVDSLMKIQGNFSIGFYQRETFIKHNVKENIEMGRNCNFVFIYSGLVHTLDTGYYFGNSSYVTLAADLKTDYGKENICRIGSIVLKENNDYYNHQIFSKEIITKYSKKAKKNLTWIDLQDIQNIPKSKLNYVVFCK